MAKLVWNQEGQNLYEYGVDHGVVYFSTTQDQYGLGVVWNGLVNVEDSNVGGDVSSYHLDGVKYLDINDPKHYQATVSAYDIPYGFMDLVGDHSLVPGMILTRQARKRFGLSYRTFIGGAEGYKLHLVYHILAQTTRHSSSTLTKTPAISTDSWKLSAVPASLSNYRPSAHFILDSEEMNPDVLDILESILYGTPTRDARLPTVEELVNLVWNWAPLLIVPDLVGGLAGLTYGIGDIYRTMEPGLNRALPDTRLVETGSSGLYHLEEA